MKLKSNHIISPEYQRIPHLDKSISQMTHDDILPDNGIEYTFSCFIQEKIDGSNMGVSWNNGPILRNRKFILKKGYSKIHTPSKIQFKSAWNWVHDHEDDIKEIEKRWDSKITIYGEWMLFKHSLLYNKLPDTFIAYDIYSSDDEKYISPEIVLNLIKGLNIHYILPEKKEFRSLDEVRNSSELKSKYKDGFAEGIVLKQTQGFFISKVYKVVNKYFERREDFNEEIIKNKLI
jgi:hypothetical protein